MDEVGNMNLDDLPDIDDLPTDFGPLAELVERTRTERGAPFAPEMLALLAALKEEDPEGFENIRGELKRAGCRVTALDQELRGLAGESDDKSPSNTNLLVQIVEEAAKLFHDDTGTGYADVEVAGHRETWRIRSEGFGRWLRLAFLERTGGAPATESMNAALNTIEAKACHMGPQRAVYIRVGEHKGRYYLDLCNDAWEVVEVDAEGWRVIANPPVRFCRTKGMLPLPTPVRGGSLELLRPFLNVASEEDFVLVVSWLLAALRPTGPYPVLVLTGEQGSAKSTFSGVLKNLVDPNKAPLRSLSREDRDLFIAASNGHVLAFDNLSGLPSWISDTLCRLATGGAFAVRQLYTDQEEALFEACRPVILNGIDEVVTRPDLMDRALPLTLEPIPEEQRRPEKEIWAEFRAAQPMILGALLEGVVEGLRRLPGVRLEKLPRMADFATWATACETAYSPEGTFLAAYAENREQAVDSVIEADQVAVAVRSFMSGKGGWQGTATDLLEALIPFAGDRVRWSKTWPQAPRALSDRLRRAATFLRTTGIEVEFDRRGHDRKRVIHLSQGQLLAETVGGAKPASAASAVPANGRTTWLPPLPELRTKPSPADAGQAAANASVRAKWLNDKGADDADDADAGVSRPPWN